MNSFRWFRRPQREAKGMRVCDVCAERFDGASGGLYTTRELATNPEFWRCHAKFFQTAVGSTLSLEEASKTYIDAVNQACASATPWLLCRECSTCVDQAWSCDIFTKIEKIYQANQAAAQFVRTGEFPAAFAGDHSICTIHGSVDRVIISKDDDHPKALSLATHCLVELRNK